MVCKKIMPFTFQERLFESAFPLRYNFVQEQRSNRIESFQSFTVQENLFKGQNSQWK